MPIDIVLSTTSLISQNSVNLFLVQPMIFAWNSTSDRHPTLSRCQHYFPKNAVLSRGLKVRFSLSHERRSTIKAHHKKKQFCHVLPRPTYSHEKSRIYIPPPPSFLVILPFMNSFVSNHLQTVAFTQATSFPLKLSDGFPVIHFSNALSVKLLITACTIICWRNAKEKFCISPNPEDICVMASSLEPKEAEVESKEESAEEEKSSP
mmetsp:Transcript_14108/g.29686  ORF Transcript_14108/g.29686 Transcript_14108/m.29686 type:complete len:206 (-) Transcript_14108:236-853(-)